MKALTPLRGVAALAVLSQHAGLPVRGYLGVDLFFLLSGFVMMHAYGTMAASWASLASFLKARLARIYPVHLLMLVLLLPLLRSGPEFSIGGLVSSLLLLQSPWHSMCWNLFSWSISAEWHAYLLFPLLAGVIRVKSARWLVIALAACALVVGINDLARHTGDITNSPVVFLRCLPEFIAGMALYRLRDLGALPAWAQSDALLAAALAGVAGLDVLRAPDGLTITLLGVLLICAAREDSAFARLLNLKPLPWLGEISYSLYMVQMVVLVALSHLAPNLPPLAHSALFCLGAFALAAPISRGFEFPARAWLRDLKLGPPLRATAGP